MLNITSISDCKKIAFSKFDSYGKLGNMCVKNTSSAVNCFMKFPFIYQRAYLHNFHLQDPIHKHCVLSMKTCYSLKIYYGFCIYEMR